MLLIALLPAPQQQHHTMLPAADPPPAALQASQPPAKGRGAYLYLAGSMPCYVWQHGLGLWTHILQQGAVWVGEHAGLQE